jgi:hypothetical protein
MDAVIEITICHVKAEAGTPANPRATVERIVREIEHILRAQVQTVVREEFTPTPEQLAAIPAVRSAGARVRVYASA